jgi:hypothetical protein
MLPARITAFPIRIAGLYTKVGVTVFAARICGGYFHFEGGILEFGYATLKSFVKWH